MKQFLLTLICVLSANFVIAQVPAFTFKKVADGAWLLYYDTTAHKKVVTKSLVIERSNHIALFEVSLSYGGSGTLHLTDDSIGAEALIGELQDRFPKKPLRYVFSTHWHPHSLTSIKPFISRGIKVVTTSSNYERLREMLDDATLKQYGDNIILADADSTVFKDKRSPVIAYRLTREEYPHIPTEDFLFYYLPRYRFLHTSCMYQRFANWRAKDKEIISTRVEDVHQFINAQNLHPKNFVTSDAFFDEHDGMASDDTLHAMFANGVTMSALEREFLDIPESMLVQHTDSVIKYIAANQIPVSILNTAVYTCLRERRLQHALAIARLQALANPSNANAWDTFGEVYYFLGDVELARRYEAQSKRIDKDFARGGEESWKRDLEDHKKIWEKAGK